MRHICDLLTRNFRNRWFPCCSSAEVAMAASIRIDSVEILPANIEGPSRNVFKTSKFVLTKPTWESDSSAFSCILCKNKFNQIRRRHHCRCCGRVLCSKCCSNKVPVPQYLVDEPERVCNACMPVVSCVTMSHSTDREFHKRSVTSLELICRDDPASVIALGGAHTLIYLTCILSGSEMSILNKITTSLHTLSLHTGAIQWLVDIGILNALNRILDISSSARDQATMATEALNTLRIYAKTSDELKRKVVESGCLGPLLELGESDNPFISLIAMTTVSLLVECSANHEAMLTQKNALRRLLTRISKSQDDKEVEVVLKIVMLLSAGNEETKHMIVCEDASVGSAISRMFTSQSASSQILSNAACSIANLATSVDDQVGLQTSVHSLLSLLSRPLPGYVIVHCIRALANFAKHEIHVNILLTNLSSIIRYLEASYGPESNCCAVKCVFNLLKHRRSEAAKLLERLGGLNVILQLSEIDSVMRDLLASLDREAASVITG